MTLRRTAEPDDVSKAEPVVDMIVFDERGPHPFQTSMPSPSPPEPATVLPEMTISGAAVVRMNSAAAGVADGVVQYLVAA